MAGKTGKKGKGEPTAPSAATSSPIGAGGASLPDDPLRMLLDAVASLRRDVDALSAAKSAATPPSPAEDAVGSSPATIDDDTIARLASALGAAPRVAIARRLRAGADTPSAIGPDVGLSSGSLYHHLREMAAANVLTASGNRYSLTPIGERLLQTLEDLTA